MWRSAILSLLAASAWAAAGQTSHAIDYPLSSGFPNYYFNEPRGVDWAVNAKVVALSPTPGDALPINVILEFHFSWNSVNGSGNQERVFTDYARGTPFDLVTAPETSGVYTYAQNAAAIPTITTRPTSAVVRFRPISLTAPNGGTATTLFEMYGDCLECEENQEARPDRSHSTWRIAGKIRVTADDNGKLASFDIVELVSETPEKLLDNNGGVQHDPDWYPERKLPRRGSSSSPTAFNACVGPSPCVGNSLSTCASRGVHCKPRRCWSRRCCR